MKRRDFLHCSATAVAAASFASSLSTVRADEAAPKLQFGADGKFKIAQFTDTHYDTTRRDIANGSVELIGETLDAEKPQLAVFTGDIVVQDTKESPNPKEMSEVGWNEILAPCVERKIPYAVMLGNHDQEKRHHHESDYDRRGTIEYLSKRPYSVTQLGPKDVFGASNYILEIFDGDKLSALLYCLDSNDYSPLEGVGGYGWFRQSQIDWYKQQSAEYTKQNGGQPIPALAFFHIPLNEYGEMILYKTFINTENDNVKPRGKNIIVGVRQEHECPGAINSGMFLAMKESGDVMATFVGHDHVNDYVALHNSIALGYGRWSGTKTTYGSDEITHGSRLFELSKDGGRSFKTWVRVRGGEKIAEIQVPQDLEVKE
ncbi:phosphohydrolase [Planctomycetales bacterium]|nr:phosphohydrolase [Planctomycetales bacterium]